MSHEDSAVSGEHRATDAASATPPDTASEIEPEVAPGRRRLAMVAAALVLVVAGAAFVLLGSSDESEFTGHADIGFELPDGTSASLADYAGEPLVLNFFASWCGPCEAEMPDFEQVHQAVGERVAFLGLAINDRPADAAEMVDRTGITYPWGIDSGDVYEHVEATGALPATVFVRANGEVVDVHLGILDAETLQAMIDELLSV